MRRFLLALVCLLLLAGRSGPVVRAGEKSDAETLTHIKQVLWPKAYRDQDAQLLGEILADEFRMIDADGVWSSKSEEIAYVRANRPAYEKFSFSIERLDIFENGTAVVAGTGTITGTDGAGAYTVRYQSSNIFIKRDGRWQAIASHVSGVKRDASRKSP